MTELSIRLHAFLTANVSSFIARSREERGQDLIEYAMIAGLVAVALVGLGVLFNPAVSRFASKMASCIDFSSTPCTG